MASSTTSSDTLSSTLTDALSSTLSDTISATISSTLSSSSSATSSSSSAAATTTQRAPHQGGVLEGSNPTVYDPTNPIILFIIQVCIIVIVCHLLHWPLSKIRQPRVIAEVVGGIILGPSVMGRIPNFSATIFPPASIPNLNLVANLGLVLYLFIIGLETDVHFLISNWRVATSVAIFGLALPFGLGCALAWGVYNAFDVDELANVRFSVFMLFIGIAIAITAFPVLCRILTELKLLDTSVGIITLSAGVANDVVGWILLALCVALVNAGNGLTALWILLCCVGYMLFLSFIVKPCLIWTLRRTGSIENEPSQSVISLILIIALASAFFTAIIGVHAIFGGFMAGLIIPRDNRFNIRVMEKLEDLIGAIFLPLYFTLSGLNTNLGLLDSGLAWGYVFATTIVAIASKIIGASIAARINGLVWRESFTIGVLMSCKGLVELIVLNIGLQAKILTTRTFTIFVVMALLATFATTPIVTVLYPPSYQQKLEAWKRGEIDWDTGAPIVSSSEGSDTARSVSSMKRLNRLLVYLRLDSMPALLNLLSLLGNPQSTDIITEKTEGDASEDLFENSVFADGPKRAVWAHGIRLLQLTDRDSSVMTVSQVAEYSRYDPIVNTFRTVGQLHNLAASGEVAIMPETRFAEALSTKSHKMSADLLVVPWSETGALSDSQLLSPATIDDKMTSSYGTFIKSIFDANDHNIAVFFAHNHEAESKAKESERAKMVRAYSFGVLKEEIPAAPLSNKPYHIFLPYFGHVDDVLALRLVLQLCEKSKATATITRLSTPSTTSEPSTSAITPTPASEDFFQIASSKLTTDMASRVRFDTATNATTAEELLQHAAAAAAAVEEGSKTPSLIVVGRESGEQVGVDEKDQKAREEPRRCLGSLASHFIVGNVQADLLVVQSKKVENPT
ncbi:K/H antiporter 1 [Drechmeria coniospora]|uniref:K/H antiporter 1 n=1 Tax=Drechmeria coniospora TaxID=98403 RepID=A0A151GKC6_DRECN|nr:K/H antiporter 1 [Drechmeria coniospora]KYK57462.1 K/H antiporter 1 [Drechmeria coniospora]ODA79367.1 hypothetical protein RJ55_04960 [Drechmeria coniospora]